MIKIRYLIIILIFLVSSCSQNNAGMRKNVAELTLSSAAGYIGYQLGDADIFTTVLTSTAGLILGGYVGDYLEKNVSNKNHVEKDFKKINENFSYFQKVIFKSFNESLIQINGKSIFIDTKVFFLKDKIVQSKIIEISYKYLKFSRKPTRYKKIQSMLEIFSKKITSELNLGGLTIKKDDLVIKFIS